MGQKRPLHLWPDGPTRAAELRSVIVEIFRLGRAQGSAAYDGTERRDWSGCRKPAAAERIDSISDDLMRADGVRLGFFQLMHFHVVLPGPALRPGSRPLQLLARFYLARS
jgi:hypothetical protein